MSDQPYRPPESDLRVPNVAVALGEPGSIDVRQCLSEAWEATWSDVPLWLAVGFVGMALIFVSAATLIGIPLLLPVFLWGIVRFYLNLLDGTASFGDLFEGFSIYGRAMPNMLATMILLFAVGLVGNSVQIYGDLAGDATISAVGTLVYLVWTLFIGLRLTFAYFFVVEQGQGPVEAMRSGWRYTTGNVGQLVALAVATFGVILLGILALLVGVIPASVLTYLMWTSAYRQMTGTGLASGASLGIGSGGTGPRGVGVTSRGTG